MRRHAATGGAATGLCFMLRDGVAVSAVLEYLCAELLEAALDGARDGGGGGGTMITLDHMLRAEGGLRALLRAAGCDPA